MPSVRDAVGGGNPFELSQVLGLIKRLLPLTLQATGASIDRLLAHALGHWKLSLSRLASQRRPL